jgi:P-type Cu+ transporter
LEEGAVERDPVCGMQLQPGQEEANFHYQGRTYHFCSVECQRLFQQDPRQYIAEARESGSPQG